MTLGDFSKHSYYCTSDKKIFHIHQVFVENEKHFCHNNIFLCDDEAIKVVKPEYLFIIKYYLWRFH